MPPYFWFLMRVWGDIAGDWEMQNCLVAYYPSSKENLYDTSTHELIILNLNKTLNDLKSNGARICTLIKNKHARWNNDFEFTGNFCQS